MGNIITTKARELIGVPFHHQGRNRAGLDCVGLVYLIGIELGYEKLKAVPKNYSKSFGSKIFYEELDRFLVPVSKEELREGDILVLGAGKDPRHMAIFCGKTPGTTYETIVHSYEKYGGVKESRINEYWKNRIVGVYRYG